MRRVLNELLAFCTADGERKRGKKAVALIINDVFSRNHGFLSRLQTTARVMGSGLK